MMELAAAGLAAVTGVLTVFTTFAKVQNVLSRLESRDLELRTEIQHLRLQLDHTTDKVELLCNGLKERIEHVNTRLTNNQRELGSTVHSIESYLQKHTEYERRS